MIYWQDMVRFVRVIARIHLDENHKRYISHFLKQDVPWQQLILLAKSQGLGGLFYYHLRGMTDVRIPESAWESIKASFEDNALDLNGIKQEAQGISRQFEKAGLSAIALQGLSLTPVYPESGLRPMGDMDILVQTEAYPRVMVALKEIGFQVANPVYPNNLLKDHLWLDVHTHILNLDRIRSRRYVFPKDLSPLWNRALPLFESARGLLRPDPMDNFILLTAHILKHSYSRLIWLVDLNETLKAVVIDRHRWDRLIERARFWQQERIVLYGLIMLEGVLKQPIPAEAKKRLGYQTLWGFEKYLLRLKIKGAALTGDHILLWCFAIQGIPKKLKFIKESIIPEDDVMDQIYLDSTTTLPFSRKLKRVVNSLKLVGHGIYQALSSGPLGKS